MSIHPWLLDVREHTFRRTRVPIHPAHDLFSRAGLDVGSARLLRTLEKKESTLGHEHGRAIRVLDLGCGTGTLGISIARAMPCGTVQVVFSDRDHLAVAVTRENARQNQLDPAGEVVKVLGAGVGYEPCRLGDEEPFDLIVSNLPAKVGQEGLRELIFGAGTLLKKGGVVAFVHVAPLTDVIDELRTDFEASGQNVETLIENKGKEHRALHWRFPGGLPDTPRRDPFDPWRRDEVRPTIKLRGVPPVDHVSVHGVEEFDSFHHRTPLLAKLLRLTLKPPPPEEKQTQERILILNPAHGFLAALVAHQRSPRQIDLIGRDTLALTVAKRNLEATLKRWKQNAATDVGIADGQAGFPFLPATPPEGEGYDLILGHFSWQEGAAARLETGRALEKALAPRGMILLATEGSRLEGLRKLASNLNLRTGREAKQRGHGAVVFRRR